MRFRQSAAVHREVLAVNKHQASVDHAVARHHTIAWNFLIGHAEIRTTMFYEHIPFFEGTFIQQHFNTLARSEFAFGMLCVDALLASAHSRGRALFF